MRYIVITVATTLLMTMWVVTPKADEVGSLPPMALKTKNMVDAAYDFVLAHEAAMSTIQDAFQHDPRFFDQENQLYLYMHAYNAQAGEAICLAQGIRPELIGKNMWNLRTPNGRLLFHELSELLKNQTRGWIEYEWLNPYTKRIQTKCSYVRKIILKGDRTAWIGSGYWEN